MIHKFLKAKKKVNIFAQMYKQSYNKYFYQFFHFFKKQIKTINTRNKY